MNRKSFLKGIVLATTSVLILFRQLKETLNSAEIGKLPPVACTLISSEIRGLFPS